MAYRSGARAHCSAMIDTLDGAAEHRRGSGTRATIILGFASIGAGLGAAVGGIAMIALHPGFLPDYPPYAASGTVAGAGIGWFLGAIAGAGASRGGRAVGRGAAIVLWIGATAAIASAVVLWTYWESFVLTEVISEGELHAIRLATLGSGVVVALTLVVASFAEPSDGGEPAHGHFAQVVSVAGIIVLATLFVTILSSTYFGQRHRLDLRMQRATEIATRLLANAQAVNEELGRFPTTRRELIHGSHVSQAPDVEVRNFRETAEGFCVAVAIVGRVRASDADDLVAFGVIEADAKRIAYVGETDLCDLA